MKKNLYIVLLFSVFSFAQQPVENRFSKEENEAAQKKAEQPKAGGFQNRGGNPGEPVPIDNHLPLLLLSGVMIIAALTYKQRKLQQ